MDGNSLTTVGDNVYASYGARVAQQGTFLSFKNGEFLAGQDGTEIPLGTKFAANMAGFRVGWRRWWDDQITDDLTELLTDQRPLQQRNSLGDTDESLWKRGTDGKPFDPWQFTNILELADGDGETFIYATGAKGGIGALGQLCKAYGKEYRQHPGQIAIIELNRDFYMHKEFGKTYFPVFKLVDWVNEDELAIPGESIGEQQAATTPEPASAPAPEPAPKAASAAAAPAQAAPATRKARF